MNKRGKRSLDESDDEEWLPPREKMNKRGKEKKDKKEKKKEKKEMEEEKEKKERSGDSKKYFYDVKFNKDNLKVKITKHEANIDKLPPNKAANEMLYNKLIMNYDIRNSKINSDSHSYISQRISQLTFLINDFENKYNPYRNNQRDYNFLHSVIECKKNECPACYTESIKYNCFTKFIKLLNSNSDINDVNVIQIIKNKYNLENDNEVNNIIDSFFGEEMYLKNIIEILDLLDAPMSVEDLLKNNYELCLSFYIQTAYIYIDWVKNHQTLFKNDPHNGRNNEQLISNIWFYITDYLILRHEIKLRVEKYRNQGGIDLEFLFLNYCYKRPDIDITKWAENNYKITLHSFLQYKSVRYENNNKIFINNDSLIKNIVTQREKVLKYNGGIYIPFAALPEFNALAKDKIYKPGTGGDLISYMNGKYIYIDIKNNWSATNDQKWLIDEYKFFNQIFIYYLFYSSFYDRNKGDEKFMILNTTNAMYFEISLQMYLQYFIITSIINNDYKINLQEISTSIISNFNGIIQDINGFPLKNYFTNELTGRLNNNEYNLTITLIDYYKNILNDNFDNILQDTTISNIKNPAISSYKNIYDNTINIFDYLNYYEQLFLINLFTTVLEPNILNTNFIKNYDNIKNVINDAYNYRRNNNSNSPQYINCIGNINQTIQKYFKIDPNDFINNIDSFCTLFLCKTCVCNNDCIC